MKTTTIPEPIRAVVRKQTRGRYQEGLLSGWETWSGASLAGRAGGQYGAVYRESRDHLVERINAALPDGWRAYTDLRLNANRRWQRVLVLRAPGGEEIPW